MRPLIVALGIMAGISAAGADTRVLDWSDLKGWEQDDHSAAYEAFKRTCGQLEDSDWDAACRANVNHADTRSFFESYFTPVIVDEGKDALFTGYYEPELEGSPRQTGPFQFPIHRLPDEVVSGTPWLTRKEIETSGVLNNRDLEIAWLSDPVDVFFLQIQGSGRIRLTDGSVLRVGFGGRNWHPYKSVGQEMIRRGLLKENEASAARIRSWVRDNPARGLKILWHNPSFIFFQEINRLSENDGPIGAMNRPLTAGRSLAVDPEYVPLGSPVWVEKNGGKPIQRLMVAQDTGAAIKGAQRGDIFFGSGAQAGDTAGRIRHGGRLIILLPKGVAAKLGDRN